MAVMNRMKVRGGQAIWLLLTALFTTRILLSQTPTGTLPPKPAVQVRLSSQAEIKVRVALVTTPVTVHDSRGTMVHNLEAKDFRVTDNGNAQKISHFGLGGDPISLVILIESSSRIEPLVSEICKAGILFTQTVM